MTPLDETQPCPVFSRIPPGVYIHAPLCVCDYCEGAVPECAVCGGTGPYRPLINVKWLGPFTTPPGWKTIAGPMFQDGFGRYRK